MGMNYAPQLDILQNTWISDVRIRYLCIPGENTEFHWSRLENTSQHAVLGANSEYTFNKLMRQ